MGALLVYDITSDTSFKNAKKWMDEIREHAEPDIVITLVGNKLDLTKTNPAKRKVPRELAEEFARKNGCLFGEASAQTDVNVRELFENLLQEIYNVKSKESHIKMEEGDTKKRRLVYDDPEFEKKKNGSNCCNM